MMKALSKSEFMKKYINDYYTKRFKKKTNDADIHQIENTIRIREHNRKHNRGGK